MSELFLVFAVLGATALCGLWVIGQMRKFMRQRENIDVVVDAAPAPTAEDDLKLAA